MAYSVPPVSFLNEGDACPECQDGAMVWQHPDDCTCHINPPCWRCVEAPMVCDKCGFSPDEDE